MRRATKRGLLAIGLVVIAGAAFLGQAVAGGGRTVEVRGGGTFEANKAVTLDFHFSRDRVNARQGETITWVNRGDLPDFHTVTIVDPGDLPASLDEVFACGEPGTVCAELFNHGTEENPIFKVEAPGSRPGLDARGDSLLIPPGGSNSATVSAQPGSTLRYMCLIHPWMQAAIRVKDD
jgi:plastocyanin